MQHVHDERYNQLIQFDKIISIFEYKLIIINIVKIISIIKNIKFKR